MLIIFTVNDQKVTHDLGQRTLVAGSSGVVKAAFTFDNSWDGLDVVVVFSNSGKECNNKPIKYDGVPIDIPPEVLIAGKLYVSVIGFGDSGTRKTTQKWDVQQAISVHPCGALGSLDILRNMAQGSVPEENVATDEEVKQMLTEVFGSEEAPDEPDDETPVVDDEDVATDEEVIQMLNALRLASLRSKGYTAEQIAALAETLQGILEDINTSLEECENHVQSPHAPATAEENDIVAIKRNGVVVAPTDKVVDILVPTKVSELTNDSQFATVQQVQSEVAGSGHLSSEVVNTLPSTQEAKPNTIYFVLQNNAGAGNQYIEYMLINGTL